MFGTGCHRRLPHPGLLPAGCTLQLASHLVCAQADDADRGTNRLNNPDLDYYTETVVYVMWSAYMHALAHVRRIQRECYRKPCTRAHARLHERRCACVPKDVLRKPNGTCAHSHRTLEDTPCTPQYCATAVPHFDALLVCMPPDLSPASHHLVLASIDKTNP